MLAPTTPPGADSKKKIGKRLAPRKVALSARILKARSSGNAEAVEDARPDRHVNSYLRQKKQNHWKEYKRFISEKPCIVTGKFGVDVAHCGPKGASNKSDDRWCLPISAEYHRWDGGPRSHHKLGKLFWDAHGLDRNALVKSFNESFSKINPDFIPLPPEAFL